MKGRFAQVIQDFKDMDEVFESPDIDNETYTLVKATIASVKKEIAA